VVDILGDEQTILELRVDSETFNRSVEDLLGGLQNARMRRERHVLRDAFEEMPEAGLVQDFKVLLE